VRGPRLPASAAVLALVALVGAAAAVSVVTSRSAPPAPSTRVAGGSSTPPRSGTVPTTGASPALPFPSVSLPDADLFDRISTVDGTLLLSGELGSTSTSITPTCVWATVDPATLRLGATIQGNCDDPAASGRTVGAVVSYLPGSNDASVGIATVEPATGGYAVGPQLFTFGDYSDTKVVTAYGGGRLWIYDVATTEGPRLLQVSATTGRLEDVVVMPKLYRPVMAANDAGAWIGNSVGGGSDGETLYRVAPGADAPTVVVPGTAYAYWLVADPDHLWAGIGPPGATAETFWKFDGLDPVPVMSAPDRGVDPTAVVGDEDEGLWTVQWDPPFTGRFSSAPRAQQVVGIDPDTGAETVVATIPPVPVSIAYAQGLGDGQAAVLGGSLYLLQTPVRGGLGDATLVRIPVPG